jgi:electron-transferring-flavoprotein dehydrogenase
MRPIDVLVVGAGPAGLATAIRLRQRLGPGAGDASVVVIDKAAAAGYHNLSGALLEPACLDELLPDWRTERSRFLDQVVPIERDELYLLFTRSAARLPGRLVPRAMRHAGDVAISVSRLAAFLAERAERLGVEVHHGFAAREAIVEGGAVRGVRLTELGLDRDGRPKSNHLPPEEVRARVTVLADGAHGPLSSGLTRPEGGDRHPQVYSLGVKAVVQFAGPNPFGNRRAVHTLGYPTRHGIFGGGFIYSLGEKHAAVGLILGLDWRYGDLDPQVEFELFRSHPLVAGLLDGGVTIATGARTIPEGGYYSLGRPTLPGVLVVGDAAGFVNVAKLKGIHDAVRSGICAADAIAEALLAEAAAGDVATTASRRYEELLIHRGIAAELRGARNYRQGFRWGLIAGAPLSLVQDRLPLALTMGLDRLATRRGARLRRAVPAGADGAAFVGLTGARHREDEPSHVTILDPRLCASCADGYAAACTHFCPADVYRWSHDRVVLSPSNCLHCMSCTVKCPYDNIRWVPPEGGEGPRYRQM